MIYILDLEKEYNRVVWDFLLNMLRRIGFGFGWGKWIRECVSFVT